MKSEPKLAVILPAGGKSVRFGGRQNKLLVELAGIRVLWRTIEAFIGRPEVAQLVLAAGESIRQAVETDPAAQTIARRWKTKWKVVDGGTSRAHSVLNGLRAVDESIDWVAVHDAARPLVSSELIGSTFAAAQKHGAAVPALPVMLTIKQAHGPLPAPVRQTIPRSSLWTMQTPQIMRRLDLIDAFARCPLPLEEVTDDAQVLELAGKEVWLVEGEECNLKITTRTDLLLAEQLLNGR